jgi:hydroxymethylglutaryl-CoA lyase
MDAVGLPTIEIVEEGMREGMQIESAQISVVDKIKLIDALSDTGLQHIVVGSFVSPKYTPQMAEIDAVVSGFTPREGVRYSALTLNERGRERAAAYGLKLSPRHPQPMAMTHLCDVFVRRNTNRSRDDELARLPMTVRKFAEQGAENACIAINAAWGSNWLGPFSQEQRMADLRLQHDEWTRAGIPVTGVSLGDPMGWNSPHIVAEQIAAIRREWPDITAFRLHLHDTRGSAMVSAYTAIIGLDERHVLTLDTAIGGMGGCPYSGHGRLTRMIPTEDLVDLLEEMGVSTGVDLAKLIEVVVQAEDVVGHELWGRVSKAGPRPRSPHLFDMDMPLVETAAQAQHFRLGPTVYEGGLHPWKAPVRSAARDAIDGC